MAVMQPGMVEVAQGQAIGKVGGTAQLQGMRWRRWVHRAGTPQPGKGQVPSRARIARSWGLVNRRRARPTSRGPHEACFVGWVDWQPVSLGDGHHLGVAAQAASHRGRDGSAVFQVAATLGVLTGQHSYVEWTTSWQD